MCRKYPHSAQTVFSVHIFTCGIHTYHESDGLSCWHRQDLPSLRWSCLWSTRQILQAGYRWLRLRLLLQGQYIRSSSTERRSCFSCLYWTSRTHYCLTNRLLWVVKIRHRSSLRPERFQSNSTELQWKAPCARLCENLVTFCCLFLSDHILCSVTWPTDTRIAVQWLTRKQNYVIVQIYDFDGSSWKEKQVAVTSCQGNCDSFPSPSPHNHVIKLQINILPVFVS